MATDLATGGRKETRSSATVRTVVVMPEEDVDTTTIARVANRITSEVADVLNHYVYALRDPRDGQVFYDGKGVGGRIFAHIAAADSNPGGGDSEDRTDPRYSK